MRLDVSGEWPPASIGDWSGFTVRLEGTKRPSRWGSPAGTMGLEPDGKTYLYAFSRSETPPGRRERLVPYELVIKRLAIGHPGTAAELVLDVPTDEVTLYLRGERRQTQLLVLLGALRLVESLPPTGRPPGSGQREDRAELQSRINRAAAAVRSRGYRVTNRSVATELGYEETALSKKLKRLDLYIPR